MSNIDLLINFLSRHYGKGWVLAKDGASITNKDADGYTNIICFPEGWEERPSHWGLNVEVKINRRLDLDGAESLSSWMRTLAEGLEDFDADSERKRMEDEEDEDEDDEDDETKAGEE